MTFTDYPVFLYGTGGHALSIFSALSMEGRALSGCIDPTSKETHFESMKVEKSLSSLPASSVFIIAVGDNFVRERVATEIFQFYGGRRLITFISEKATVSPFAYLDEGVVALPGSYIGPHAKIEVGVVVNTGAIVEHHCNVESFASLAPGAVLLGNAKVGAHSNIGPGAVVDSKVKVGSNVVLGANSFLRMDLPSDVLAFGTPAKVVRSRVEGQPYLKS